MGIIGWVILGGIAGWIASLIVDNKGNGLLVNIVVGVIGAVIGGFIFNATGGEGVTGFNIWSFFVAVVGAVVLLWLVNLVTKK